MGLVGTAGSLTKGGGCSPLVYFRERNIDLLFHYLCIRWLILLCSLARGPHPQPWCIRMMLPTLFSPPAGLSSHLVIVL